MFKETTAGQTNYCLACEQEMREYHNPPKHTCGLAIPQSTQNQPVQDRDWEEEFLIYQIKNHFIIWKENESTNWHINYDAIKSFIAEQIGEAEARGKKIGAEMEKEKVSIIARNLIPIKGRERHNEAVLALRLSDIKNEKE